MNSPPKHCCCRKFACDPAVTGTDFGIIDEDAVEGLLTTPFAKGGSWNRAASRDLYPPGRREQAMVELTRILR